METLMVPISPGELLDKITILEIKSERILDPDKLRNVRHELDELQRLWQESVAADALAADRDEMKEVNGELWDIEDRIRDKEAAKEFDAEFIEIARSVYYTNDRRAEIKRRVNVKLGSAIVEEKSYADYA